MNFFDTQYHHLSLIFISIGLGLTFTPKELIQLQTYFMKYSKTVLIASLTINSRHIGYFLPLKRVFMAKKIIVCMIFNGFSSSHLY